jgi:hypothetical protein
VARELQHQDRRRVVNPLSIYISLQVKYDSNPAPEKIDTDTALAFGIEAGF